MTRGTTDTGRMSGPIVISANRSRSVAFKLLRWPRPVNRRDSYDGLGVIVAVGVVVYA
jgi:hypothetical protein